MKTNFDEVKRVLSENGLTLVRIESRHKEVTLVAVPHWEMLERDSIQDWVDRFIDQGAEDYLRTFIAKAIDVSKKRALQGPVVGTSE